MYTGMSQGYDNNFSNVYSSCYSCRSSYSSSNSTYNSISSSSVGYSNSNGNSRVYSIQNNNYSLDNMLNHSVSGIKVDFETTPKILTRDKYLGEISKNYLLLSTSNNSNSNNNNNNNNNNLKNSYIFLNHIRPKTDIVNTIGSISEFIDSAFEKTTGFLLPKDIEIHILNRNEFKAVHEKLNLIWNEGISGFSLNGNNKRHSRIFIKQDELDKVMVVVGHELGHIISPTLVNKHDEEAKAFAFEFAWIKTIHENNIANLSFNLNPNPPAINGLHNIAHFFISKLVSQGKKAIEIYKKLVSGKISILDSLSLEQIINT